ncbi:MAG: DUF4102 domain-containing protein [Alphaproteobacteria bacterium]|nr:DUF4102 domain-containing protein [Alphaproteobacteria bacterium]
MLDPLNWWGLRRPSGTIAAGDFGFQGKNEKRPFGCRLLFAFVRVRLAVSPEKMARPRGVEPLTPRSVVSFGGISRAITGYRPLPVAVLPGFGLRVRGPTARYPDGTKSWVLLYPFGSAKKRLTIEPGYPALGLADAREKAREALRTLGRGEDQSASNARWCNRCANRRSIPSRP